MNKGKEPSIYPTFPIQNVVQDKQIVDNRFSLEEYSS